MCNESDAGDIQCSCHEGYQLEADQRSCRDIDECRSGQNDCDHNCINISGSYECSCRHGFILSANKRSCTDVDECEDRNGGCEQICNNSQGSYNCACGGGFIPEKTDRKKCKKIENYHYDSYLASSGRVHDDDHR